METETVLLIGSISIFVVAIIIGALQVKQMNEKALERIEEIKKITYKDKKSIHKEIEETLAERKRILDSIQTK